MGRRGGGGGVWLMGPGGVLEPLGGFRQGVAGGVVGDGGLAVSWEAIELGASVGLTVHGFCGFALGRDVTTAKKTEKSFGDMPLARALAAAGVPASYCPSCFCSGS